MSGDRQDPDRRFMRIVVTGFVLLILLLLGMLLAVELGRITH